MEEFDKFKIKLIPMFMVIALVIFIVQMMKERKESQEFQSIELVGEIVGEKIESTWEHKSSVRIKFTSGQKCSIESSRNGLYKPADITEFIEPGDYLTKGKRTDSIYVVRDGVVYFFLLGKDINQAKAQRK